jgi:hypothetical protein
MAGRPAGAENKHKPVRDALRMEMLLAEEGKETPAHKGSLRWAARQMLIRAGEETQAFKEIADRLDGKVPQGIGGTDELPPIETHELTDEEAARRMAHIMLNAKREGKTKK